LKQGFEARFPGLFPGFVFCHLANFCPGCLPAKI
jgi:hypothetical protein